MNENIIIRALKIMEPFVYFHTHKIDDELLNKAIEAAGSIEIDVSIDSNGLPFIGHPLSFYDYKNLRPPNNLALETVIDRIEDTNLIVIIDRKDVRAIDWTYKAIERLGKNRIIVHSWIDSLLFTPYDKDLNIEPHWIHEDLPLGVLEKLHTDTDVPLILSSRGLSNRYIEDHYGEVMKRIQITVKKTGAVINLNLPNNEVPSTSILNTLINDGILTLLNIDTVPSEHLPSVYIGMTNTLSKQTHIY